MGSKKPRKKVPRKKILAEIVEELKKLGRRLTFDDLLAISIGVLGAKHLKHPYGFLWGSVGYKLARSESNISSGAGLATLAALGLAGIPPEVWQEMYEGSLPKRPDWYPDLPKELNLPRFR